MSYTSWKMFDVIFNSSAERNVNRLGMPYNSERADRATNSSALTLYTNMKIKNNNLRYNHTWKFKEANYYLKIPRPNDKNTRLWL